MAEQKTADTRLDEMGTFLKTSGLLAIAGSAIGFWLLTWLKGEASELFHGLCCNLGFGWFALDEGWGAISVALIVAALPVSVFWRAKWIGSRKRAKPPSLRELMLRSVLAIQTLAGDAPDPASAAGAKAVATAPLEPGHSPDPAPAAANQLAAEHRA